MDVSRDELSNNRPFACQEIYGYVHLKSGVSAGLCVINVRFTPPLGGQNVDNNFLAETLKLNLIRGSYHWKVGVEDPPVHENL